MHRKSLRAGLFIAVSLLFMATSAAAQAKVQKGPDAPLLWHSVDIGRQDVFLGPGGSEMLPDLSRITFVRDETGGHSTKFRIKDGLGRTWVAKIGDEAQPETAAVRLLAAIGYVTEVNYLVPSMTIPGRGTFENVRLEARPKDAKRGKHWRWGHTPFEKSNEMRGLKLMMALINNWDLKTDNNVVIKTGGRRHYVVSDLGASFGSTGSNPLPLFWRIGRSRNIPSDYRETSFVTAATDGRVSVMYYGKNRIRMRRITIANARWLADLLRQLSDAQISDAFRAANYSQKEIDLLTSSLKERIAQLDRAANDGQVAGNK